MSEEEQLLVVNRLHSILRPFMLRREKREVETDMPDKVEKIVRCALTESQRVLYESVLSGNVSLHNKMVQLRKICNHPRCCFIRQCVHRLAVNRSKSMLTLCGYAANLHYWIIFCRKLFVTKHRVLIFNQMTKCMDILDQYLTMAGLQIPQT